MFERILMFAAETEVVTNDMAKRMPAQSKVPEPCTEDWLDGDVEFGWVSASIEGRRHSRGQFRALG